LVFVVKYKLFFVSISVFGDYEKFGGEAYICLPIHAFTSLKYQVIADVLSNK